MRTPRALVGLVGAAANVNFLLAGAVGSRLDLERGVISELSVPGQPGAVLFRVGDGLTGVAAAVLARGARTRLRSVALGVFGVGTFLSALVPLTCAPSLTAGACPASSHPPQLVHDAVSVLGTAAAAVGSVALALAARGPLHRVLAWTTVVGVVGMGGVQTVSFLAGGNGGGGASQQVQVAAVSAWLLLEAAAPARAGRAGAQRGAGSSAGR